MYTLGNNSINGIKLNEEIFDYEKSEWKIIHLESFIDELYGWIGESLQAGRDDAQLMKDDLIMIAKWDDEYIFSSISTNDYVGVGDARFTDICKELLELNKQSVRKLIEVKMKVLVEYNSSVLDPQDVLDMAHVCFIEKDSDSCDVYTGDDVEVVDHLSESFKKWKR
jgi:hypothetical protein